MAWFIGQSALMIVLAFLVGLLVGWLIWHRRETRPDAEAQAVAMPAESTASRPAAVDDPATVAGAVAVVSTPDAEAAEAAETPEPAVASAPAETPEPAVASAPVEPDDLARVEGIGPKIAAALVAAGIRTYRELADAGVSAMEAAINAAGITFAPSIVTWSQQARLLADGDEDGFIALTDRLIAGRDVPAKIAVEPASAPIEPADATSVTDATNATNATNVASVTDATVSAGEPERTDAARRASGGRRAAGSRRDRVRQS